MNMRGTNSERNKNYVVINKGRTHLKVFAFELDSTKRQNTRKMTSEYVYIVKCTAHSENTVKKINILPETINIQVTSNTTYMNENFEQTKNLIRLYM